MSAPALRVPFTKELARYSVLRLNCAFPIPLR